MKESARKTGLASGEFYDGTSLLEEARRYKTSREFLEIMRSNFYHADQLVAVGVGPRLLAVSCSLPQTFIGRDINPGSIQRALEFARDWKRYRQAEPFKTEFDWLDQERVQVKLDRIDEWTFELGSSFGNENADGYLASELFLHMSHAEVKGVFQEARRVLYSSGRMVFTVYPSGREDSLDEQFAELAGKAGVARRKVIRSGELNVKFLADKLAEAMPEIYGANKTKFWLDLQKIRVFKEEDIERMCKDAGLTLTFKQDVRCGMFPFAYRLVYSARRM